MSIKRMSAVWDKSKAAGVNLLLLLSLADYANELGYCWPGIEEQAQRTRTSKTTVMRIHHRLVKAGELYIHHSRRGGNRYLVLPGLTDDQVREGLKTHFDLSEEKITVILDQIHKCQNDSNEPPKCQNDTSEVAQLCDIRSSTAVAHDPSVNRQRNRQKPATKNVAGAHAPTSGPPAPKPPRLDITLIDAYLDALDGYGRKPIEANHYARRVKIAAAMVKAGVSPRDVRDYLAHVYEDEFDPFGDTRWQQQTGAIPLEKVAANLPGWMVDNRPRRTLDENGRDPYYDYENDPASKFKMLGGGER